MNDCDGRLPLRSPLTRLVMLVVVAVVTSSCGACPATPARATVTAAATALDVGVAALESGVDDVARAEFAKVTALLPQEPAGLANDGLLLLRRQANDEAAAQLERAAALLPDAVPILKLQATAAHRLGRTVDAVTLLRRALRVRPEDEGAAYGLAMQLEAERSAAALREAAETMETLAVRSANLAAVVEWIRLAAGAGERRSVERALSAAADHASSWPSAAQTRFEGVRAIVAEGDLRAAAVEAVFLKNVLLPEPAYRRALARLQPDAGEPLRSLLTQTADRPTVGQPDTAVRVTASRVDGAAGPVGDVTWLTPDGTNWVVATGGQSGVWVGGAGQVLGEAASAIAAVDVNNDFRQDLVVVSGAGLRLVQTGADGPGVAGRIAAAGNRQFSRVWPADVDLDGDLDLVASGESAVVVYRNNTDGTFTETQPFGGIPGVIDFVWADFDGEGTPDAAFLLRSGEVSVGLNERSGAFAVVRPELPSAATAIAWGAFDSESAGFGLVTAHTNNALFYSTIDDDRRWRGRPLAGTGSSATVHRLIVADLDNSGELDILGAAAGTTSVWLGNGDDFVAAAPAPLDAHGVGDVDGDGTLEVIGVDADGWPVIGTVAQTLGYKAQVFRPRAASATGDQRINSFGIGGEVDVRVGRHQQRVMINGAQVHVGLGAADRADLVRIIWPNGVLQAEFDVPAGAAIPADQRLKGSCPWLFGWDGTGMNFLTDVIWRSPLGLRINAQATADVLMTEDRVRIPGDRLVARDGAYDLRITAELWETHFFDLVGLAAVDHPAGTEVFIDERFAIPAPSLDAIVTGPLQSLAAARDDAGRDVTEIVERRDDRHLAFAGLGAYQGITRQHFVEFELPASAPRSGPLWLVATGWVHPTDSSVNVAISQGQHPVPMGLSLAVETAPGVYETVRPNLGFPSGKDKNVLIDLSGVFGGTGARRARLSTNLEIYWDRIAWAVGRPDVDVALRPLTLTSADLGFRGFSKTTQPAASVPERPLYELAGTAPRWRDLEGYYTRFGDVLPLLGAVDDRYVILNAGDELRMRFASLPPPAAGLIRDFVFTGDGWVKDGDFNTSFSRTVLPLPTHRDGRYDRAPGSLFTDPVYLRHPGDFDDYHTRYVAPKVR